MRSRTRRVAIRENIGFLLAKAAQRWNELLYERFCREHFEEVSPAYGSILIPLFEEDGLQMSELAKRARLTKQTMTTMVKLMEQRALIERRRDPNDARAFRIYLTKRSRQFKSVAEGVLKEMDGLVKSHLSKEDVSSLMRSLQQLIEMRP